jgi:hypothetical protein
MPTKEARICFAAVRVKHWVLRHYLWVALTLLLLALATGLIVKLQDWKGWLAVIGVPFSFLLTIQKQKTEELELFRKLFKEFNARYDSLHDKMNTVVRELENDGISCEAKAKDLLFKYFNLCGEEYLFFIQGYIYPEVWRAWYNGMKAFRRNSWIKKLWDEELQADSYYGLHFEDQETEKRERPGQGSGCPDGDPRDGVPPREGAPGARQDARPVEENDERLPKASKKSCSAKNGT